MIVKIFIYSYLFLLFLSLLFVTIEHKMTESPKSKFGKWWRKYIVGFYSE